MQVWIRLGTEVESSYETFAGHGEDWQRIHSLPGYKPAIVAPRESEPEAEPSQVLQLFGDWTLSPHAFLRKQERKFTDDEIALAVVAPEVVVPCEQVEGRRFQRRGRLTAVTAPHDKVVVTLLFSNHDNYIDYLNDLDPTVKEPIAP